MHSHISIDARVARLVADLARLARVPADVATIKRLLDAVQSALDDLTAVLDRGADVTPAARHAYACGLLLAIAAPRAVDLGPDRFRMRATGERLLDMVERWVPDADRAKRAWLPAAPPPPPMAEA